MPDLGPQLRAAREAVGLTQVQLGERIGLPQAMLSEFETGRRTPPYGVLLRLCDALQVSAVTTPSGWRLVPQSHAEAILRRIPEAE